MKKHVKKICYACGLYLDEYPYNPSYLTPNHSVICPCCGIHYGYDDDGAGEIIPDELTYSHWKFGDEHHKKILNFWRLKWISEGMNWKHEGSFGSKPERWDPIEQLKNIPEEFIDEQTKQLIEKHS